MKIFDSSIFTDYDQSLKLVVAVGLDADHS